MTCSTTSGSGRPLRALAQRGHELHERTDRCPGLAAQLGRRFPQAHAARLRGVLQRFDRPRADAARREVHHPEEARIVVGAGEEAQVRERVLHLLPLEEAQAPVDAVRDPRREERVLDHPRLRVRPVEDGDLAPREAVARERLDLLRHPVRFVAVGLRLVDAQRLALARRRPQVLAEPAPVVRDERVRGVQDVAVRAVVLFQPDHVPDLELALEVGHVADVRAAEPVDRLVVVAHREEGILLPGEELQPLVLQPVRVLELVDEDVPEARLIVSAQHLVPLQELVAAQQQLGEVGDALLPGLLVVRGVELARATAELVVAGRDLVRPQPLLLLVVDVPLHRPGLEAVLVDVHALEHPLHERELVLRIEDLEALRQAGVAVMRAQHPVAEAVKGADPHPARRHRQHRRDAREHLLRRLVGEGHREHAGRAHVAGVDQPGDARREHARLPRSRAGEDQRVLAREGDGLELLGVEVIEEAGHSRLLASRRDSTCSASPVRAPRGPGAQIRPAGRSSPIRRRCPCASGASPAGAARSRRASPRCRRPA